MEMCSVAINFSKASLYELHIVSQIQRKLVGDIIREAVEKQIADLRQSEDFRARAKVLQEQHAEAIGRLLSKEA